MTSEKYFLKWLREAGRGHISAFLSWGCLAGYVLIKGIQMAVSTEYHFYGIGSRELLWICAGLGAALSLLEFSYLLQPAKLDFYYSLPVKKSTIFWSRYVHGFLHFMVPFCLAVVICGIFESSLDLDFFPYSGSYTGRSIFVFAAVFLIFYHMGILLITICGNIIPAILGYGGCLFYGHILVGNVLTTWAENYFRTYYRIPLLEKLDVILVPLSLAGQMTGSGLFDKKLVFEYAPAGAEVAAAFGWILISFLLFAVAQRKRKAERVGKIFVLPMAERAVKFLLSFLAGVWSASFFTDLSGLAREHPMAGAGISILAGIFAASAVHFLVEWGLGSSNKNISGRTQSSQPDGDGGGRFIWRKWQLAGECAAVVLAGTIFFAGASAFDSFLPQESEIEAIGISVDGIGMNQECYAQILLRGDRYETAEQLEKYVLAEDGKTAAQAWITSLVEKQNFARSDEEEMESTPTAASGMPYGYIHAAVCYHMKNGNEVYRLYPVDAEDIQAFSFVYETREYKNIAYPSVDGEQLVDARFNWSDGIMDTPLKLTEEEKKAIVNAYQKDVEGMKMEELEEDLPLGFVDIASETRRLSGKFVIYPFFTETCKLLEACGIPIRKTLSDYPVRSVSVGSVSVNGMGEHSSKYYEEPEEIAQWTKKAVPEEFDLQPFLYPLDYSQEIRAEVTDETTNSIVNVYCYCLEE